jgi:hypothetical protein
LRGVGNEFGTALGAAEIIVLTGVLGAMWARRRIDLHAANGIANVSILVVRMAFRAMLVGRICVIMSHFEPAS